MQHIEFLKIYLNFSDYSHLRLYCRNEFCKLWLIRSISINGKIVIKISGEWLNLFTLLSKCLLNVYPKYVLGVEVQLFQDLNLLNVLWIGCRGSKESVTRTDHQMVIKRKCEEISGVFV